MKKNFLQLMMLFAFTLAFNSTAFSANELFRSVATGNWNSTSTWQMSTDGGGSWIAATTTPSTVSSSITVRSPNTVTVTADVSVDQLTVEGGATLSINSTIILTIVDGSSADLALNSGAIINGAGTLQTQGSATQLNGVSFNVALKINSGLTTITNFNGPFIASLNNPITIDPGATLKANDGGYTLQANSTVTNNGKLSAGGSSSTFTMRGSSLVNNDTVTGSIVNFDSTTALSGTGIYTPNTININSSGNVSLSINMLFSPAATLNVYNGGTLNPNTRTLTINSGTFICHSGGNVTSSGIFQTQSAVTLNVRNGGNFNGTLKVNSGITTAVNFDGPFIAVLKGTITIDAGAELRVNGGGYTAQATSNVTNNGIISAPTGSTFSMRGPLLTNSGSISPINLNFDSTTNVSSTGTFNGSNININSTGVVTLITNVIFSPVNTFTINTGGIFTPGTKTFTFNSGTLLVNNGGTVSGVGINAGILQTQGTVSFVFRNGSVFNSAVKVNTGTLTAYNDNGPFNAVYNGNITVDAGATLTVLGGGYTSQVNGNVTNNGTITSGGGSTYIIKGSSLINNGTINPTTLNFDSTCSLSGAGTFSSTNTNINGSGNVSLSGNVTFTTANFTIIAGGILNPNTRTFTMNGGNFNCNSGGNVSNSGIFQTQGAVAFQPKNGSNFFAPLKVNTGTTNAFDGGGPFVAFIRGTITVDPGAILSVNGGGYFISAFGSVTNNGTITSGGGSTFIMRGATMTNNGSINPAFLNFDSTCSLSGAGTFSSTNTNINGSGNVSLSSNVTFSSTNFTINAAGILNPNTRTFTMNAGSFTCNSGGNVSNSGIFQTQGVVTFQPKNGSNFLAPLKVNTGTTNAFDGGGPFVAFIRGTITVDAGAVLSVNGGGYFAYAYGSVTNNGTITSGGGSTFRFYGANLTNNGLINPSSFLFDTAAHTLQGTGSWGTTANILSGSTVTLASNHQMQNVSVNSGGTFNLSTFKLLLTASNPISNSGTFNTTTGAVEYNGSSSQSISTTGITYNKLRINNSTGTTLPGPVTVNDTLSVILGDLDLNGQILTIAPSGYLTETPGNTVTGTSGYITTTRTLNAPSGLNVGGLGAVLTTAANLGSTEIRRGHGQQNNLGGNTSILRYYDITPTTNTGLNATLVFNFDESELNGKVESALKLFRSTNTGSTWTLEGGTVSTPSNNITLAGIGAFSRWSASSTSAVASQLKLFMEAFYNLSTNRLNMRDTVRAYLRNNTTPFVVVDSAKSVIDSVAYTGSFLFANAPTGTYYIQLKHRNSLETWSKSGGEAYTLGSAFSYDFTTDSAKAFGNNMKKVAAKWSMFSGDVNQNGNVNLTDILDVTNASSLFTTGYVVTDVNGDRTVNLQDIIFTSNNSNLFVTKITP